MPMDITTVKWPLFLLLTTSSLSLNAAEWQTVPKIYVEEMYSSNIERQRSDETESFVTEVSPGFALQGLGANFTAALNYALTGIYYTDDSDAKTSYHKADGNLAYSPWRPVTLYSSASYDQAITNLDRGLSNDIVSRQGNVSDRQQLVVGTRYSNQHAGWMVVDSDVSYRWVKADDTGPDSFDNTESHTIQFSTTQGDRWDRIFWVGQYDDMRESSDTEPSLHTRYGKAQLGYFVWQHLGVYARYSYDDNQYSSVADNDQTLKSYGGGIRFSTGPKLVVDLGYNSVIDGDESDYWNASVNWNPTQLTSLYADYDRRFYGESYALSLSHGTRKLQNSIQYNESVTTFSQSGNGSIDADLWCPLGGGGSLNDCSFAQPNQPPPPGQEVVSESLPYSSVNNQPYLNKMWVWTTALRLQKNTLLFNAYYSKREYGGQEPARSDEKTGGASLTLDTRLNERSSLDNRIVYRRFERDTESGDDTEWSIRSAYIRQLWPSTSANVAAEYNTRDSYNGGTDYDEVRLLAGIRSQF
ncbi:TIGR03016 family PEP-CTERM system-associated outer membrane protein [Corallincola spongiicola]|uniref:TIGR03016 family PEP-CTERM system-associated outer membrane protein n=1 Tax=Corallincola spongiicola TaxID=2520508 RepID=A0ABY1WQ11_9GAMM|nr:TIGR03016 family PEP-CTERM system-associated outer membrane protein [Corallincola spongiicola]TAA46811.1 TIGR03016 family PEP-CTERM system-associated outer membrane protein [Corallincola spongiicola]